MVRELVPSLEKGSLERFPSWVCGCAVGGPPCLGNALGSTPGMGILNAVKELASFDGGFRL